MATDYQLKTIIIGDMAVGKSSFMMRFVKDSYLDFYNTTIGTEFGIKTIQINRHNVKMQI